MKLQTPSHEHEMETSNLKRKISKTGYTLIEILVAVSILALVFGLGTANFRDFQRRQALAGVVKQIQGDLRLAQTDAITGQKPTSGCTGPLDSYEFLAVPTSEYKIQINCGESLPPVKDVILPSGTTISTSSINPLKFKVLGQGTNLNNTNWTLSVSQTGITTPATVTVTPGGEIK